jgi:uncharacterized membrane protein YphA (DoxX/SURF4 family)
MEHGYSWYQHFLSAVVVPHAATFGTLVVIAEIYVAIALVFGLTTRLAACVAIFLPLNYLCAKARCLGDQASTNPILSSLLLFS